MFKRNINAQRLAFGLLAAVLIAALFSLPAARALASDFLGLFRVQKFAPISVSPEQIARLENLQLDENMYPGAFEWIEEPGQMVEVETIEAASAESGMRRLLEYSSSLGQPAEIGVRDGGTGRLVVDLAGSRTLLEAVDIDPALLPDSLDGAEINATMSPSVVMSWEENETILIQAPSPEVSYPDGFDPAPIGQAVLQLLGMPEEEAYRLSRNVDWTTTLILPIPTDLASFQEVPVAGTTGLLVTELNGQHSALVWQNNGRVYMLANGGNSEALIELVDGS